MAGDLGSYDGSMASEPVGTRPASWRPQSGAGWANTGSSTPGASGMRGRGDGGPWARLGRTDSRVALLQSGAGRKKK